MVDEENFFEEEDGDIREGIWSREIGYVYKRRMVVTWWWWRGGDGRCGGGRSGGDEVVVTWLC